MRTPKDLQHPRPGYPRGSPKTNGVTMQRRRAFVLKLLHAGAQESTVLELAAGGSVSPELGEDLTPEQVRTVLNEVRAEMRRQFEDQVSSFRAEQVARLQRDLVEMRLSAGKSWLDIARHEKLLADVTGTRQIRVQVSVDATLQMGLAAVIGGMTGEDYDRLVLEQEEVERDARELKLLKGGKG